MWACGCASLCPARLRSRMSCTCRIGPRASARWRSATEEVGPGEAQGPGSMGRSRKQVVGSLTLELERARAAAGGESARRWLGPPCPSGRILTRSPIVASCHPGSSHDPSRRRQSLEVSSHYYSSRHAHGMQPKASTACNARRAKNNHSCIPYSCFFRHLLRTCTREYEWEGNHLMRSRLLVETCPPSLT